MRWHERQVAVGLDALLVDQDMARAVHRLDREHPLLGFGDEHVGPVIVPVAGLLPEHAVEQLRCLHLAVVGRLQPLAHVRLDRPPDCPALRVPEHAADRLFLQVEQVEFPTEAAVVALLGLLEAGEIGLELRLVRPGRAVDAGELRILRIAAPVGAGDFHQLEGLEPAGRRHVRPATQIKPVALPVQADVLARRDAADDLGLVVLAQGRESGDRLLARNHPPGHRQVGADELVHLRLEEREILGGERPAVGEVVEEAIVDDRTDGHLGVGVDRLHGLRQEVRRRVADDLQRIGVLRRHDLDGGIAVDDVGQVDQPPVDLAGERRLGQPRTDRGRDVTDADGGRKRLLASIGERDYGHRRDHPADKGGVVCRPAEDTVKARCPAAAAACHSRSAPGSPARRRRPRPGC